MHAIMTLISRRESAFSILCFVLNIFQINTEIISFNYKNIYQVHYISQFALYCKRMQIYDLYLKQQHPYIVSMEEISLFDPHYQHQFRKKILEIDPAAYEHRRKLRFNLALLSDAQPLLFSHTSSYQHAKTKNPQQTSKQSKKLDKRCILKYFRSLELKKSSEAESSNIENICKYYRLKHENPGCQPQPKLEPSATYRSIKSRADNNNSKTKSLMRIIKHSTLRSSHLTFPKPDELSPKIQFNLKGNSKSNKQNFVSQKSTLPTEMDSKKQLTLRQSITNVRKANPDLINLTTLNSIVSPVLNLYHLQKMSTEGNLVPQEYNNEYRKSYDVQYSQYQESFPKAHKVTNKGNTPHNGRLHKENQFSILQRQKYGKLKQHRPYEYLANLILNQKSIQQDSTSPSKL